MSKQIQDLYEQREGAVAEARERLDEINSNTDDARAAELEEQHDNAMSVVEALDKKIEREERMERLTKRFEDREYQRRSDERSRNTPDLDGRGADGALTDGEERTYRSAFHELLKAGGQVHMLEEEDRNLITSGYNALSTEDRQQVTTTDTAGGFTVPTELQNLLIKAMEAWGPMYGDIAQVLNTAGGNQLDMPTVDDTSVDAVGPKTEGADLTDDGGKDVVFGQKALNAFVYDTEFVRFSMELVQDSIFNIEIILADLLAERLAKKANGVLTTGTGSNQPHGIVTAASSGVVAAAVAAIASDEIIDLEHSVDPAYRGSPSCRYMFNDNVLKAVRKLKDGDGNYLWTAGNFQQGVPGTLNGRNYSINQAMADPAAGARSMVFGDFKKYYVRKVGNIMLGILRERFWPNLGIAGLVRLDGELADTRAMKALVQAAS